MLLNFKIKNFKSFANETVFSMKPAPKQRDLEYSILKKQIGKSTFKALSTSVIYGPNASGKTNIIGAMETFISIVLRGHIKNVEIQSFNTAMYKLDLIPNTKLKKPAPTLFAIEFLMEDKHVEYEIELDLGLFFDDTYERKVISESLVVDQITKFKRAKGKIVQYVKDDNYLLELINKNLEKDALFLTNGFRNVVDKTLANEITEYLEKKYTIVYRSDRYRLSRKLEKDNYISIDEELTQVAHKFGACANNIAFVQRKAEGETSKLGVHIESEKSKDFILPLELIESYGTVRFLNIYPIIKSTLNEGGILIIDEFDASLHPMVLMNIINIFHNDEINKKNAQLIFNTHNPIFLRNTLFRRDEIKFIEIENNSSIIYALSDFGTSGDKGVRKTEDYMKNYFINKYGAITDIDLTDFFDKD